MLSRFVIAFLQIVCVILLHQKNDAQSIFFGPKEMVFAKSKFTFSELLFSVGKFQIYCLNERNKWSKANYIQ